MNYTSGPWEVDSGNCIVTVDPIVDVGNGYMVRKQIAELYLGPQSRIDAKLIAAAPELYELILSILELGKRDLTNSKYDNYFLSAKEILQKVQG